MTRLFARRMAVEMEEISDEMAVAVSGGFGSSGTPSMPGGDREIAPGVWVDPIPGRPGPKIPVAPTFGINEQ